MSSTPRVSVVLPVHNGERYLRESVETVLGQDFDDIELVVLDDSSSDGSPGIVRSYMDQRIRFLPNPEHYGLFKTLNRGFEEAKAPLVRIWAQDDRMRPDCLREFVRFADSHPTAGMVYCAFSNIDATGRSTGGHSAYDAQRARTPELADPDLSALLFWCYGCLPGNISTVMLRRDVWHEVGGFITGFQQAPDYDMWVRISEHRSVGYLPKRLVELRSHVGQLSRVGREQMTTIEEEYPVIERLRARLNGVLSPAELRRSWATGRGRQHVQWIARALARGDVRSAAKGVVAVRRYGHFGMQVAFWLASLNGRLVKPQPETLFDLAANRLRTRRERS